MLSLPIIVSVSLAVFAGIFITGGLHEEGLANTFRAFFEGKDKDEIIELMKSSNIGTYSSLSLIILITIKITALTSLFDQQVIDREEFRDILVQGEVLPSANEAKTE